MYPILCVFKLQPLSKTSGLIITPENVLVYASFIHPSVAILNRLIHVGSGFRAVDVLKIPLGQVQLLSTIKVTVGLKPRPANVDSDPVVEISDGTKYNRFSIVDPTNFPNHSPCYARRASQDNTLVPPSSEQASVYQMIFEPSHCYGACTAPYGNRYINTVRFNDRLDLSKELSLVVRKDDGSSAEYDFYYFMIEII